MPRPKTKIDILSAIDQLDTVERESLFLKLADRLSFAPFWPSRFMIAEYPGIVRSENVCGGSARIIRTRIPIWTLERMRQLGVSEADILKSYPSLRAVDLTQAWSYAVSHRDEIEKEIRENEEE